MRERSGWVWWTVAVAAAAVSMMTSMPSLAARAAAPSQWPMYGHDSAGGRVNAVETTLAPAAVHRGLHVAWRFPTAPVYGTPAVVDGHVYAADIAGNVYALSAATGGLLWVAHVGPAATFPFVVTSSPLVLGQLVIVGDQNGTVWALDRPTGIVRWVQRPNAYGVPAIYGSPVSATVRTPTGSRQLVLVPVASNEETFTPTALQPCCRSRGSVAALDPADGSIVWQTFTISDAAAAAGGSGATIWSTPTFDRALNRVYVTTGNNYGNTATRHVTPTSEAILALDAATGRIVWDNKRTPDDTWSYAYRGFAPGHVDADFGDSPKLFRLASGRSVVAAGQKSGFMHLLDAATGQTLAVRQFLPGGGLGGFFADSAQDGGVLFAPGNDWTGYGGGELGAVAGSPPPKSGSVVAISAAAGQLQERWRFTTLGSPMLCGVAVANGVVYAQASRDGHLYAIDERTGAVLTSISVGPSVNGPAIAEGHIFVGVGDVGGFAGYDPTSGAVLALAPR